MNTPDANAPLAPAAGSARKCEWVIRISPRFVQCQYPATQYDPNAGSAYFCDAHAQDYADYFGDESLRPLLGELCAVCGKQLRESEWIVRTEDGLAHEVCCNRDGPTSSNG
jgi:hypothetical protein